MTEQANNTTVADYVRVIRRRWLLVLAVTIIFGGATAAVSAVQKASYQATASESVQDISEDLNLIGTPAGTTSTPIQVADAHVSQVTRAVVATAVKAQLRSPLSLAGLRAKVDVQVDQNSALVDITGRGRTAAEAAAVANAFAQQDASLSTLEARAGFATQARALNARIRRLAAGQDATTRAIYVEELSRLQSLASVAQPVAVNTQANVPSAPVSPRPVRNTVVALVFGLLLGIALAYVRETLDRRLRRPHEVESAFPHPILGRMRRSALGRTGLAAPPDGATLGPLANADAEAVRVLRHNVRYLVPDGGMHTVLVTSAMAQEGKSTVSCCLAVASAAAGQRTLLVECDLRRPVLAQRAGLNDAPGLTDYLTGHAEPAEILQSVPVSYPDTAPANGADPTAGTLVCITSGSPAPRPAELIASDRFHRFLDEAAEAYDLVIIDSPPLLAAADALEIVPVVSAVLVCLRLGQTTRDQLRAAERALERLPLRPTGVVLTNVADRDPDYQYGYYYRPAAEVSS